MDRLTAFVAINHLKLRLQYLDRHPELIGVDMTTTPKLQGLAKAMKMLESDLEDDAGKLLEKVESVGARGRAAIAKGHDKIDSKANIVGEIESYVAALEGANGGPTLGDSSALPEEPDPINRRGHPV